ncbi:MAG: PEP-CTERM sorting domain-containing protein [Planctomycetota bacterium]
MSTSSSGLLASIAAFNEFDGGPNEQPNYAYVDGDGSGDFGLGDILYGIAQIDQVTPDSGASANVPPANIALAFAAEVVAVNVVADVPGILSVADFTFGAVTDTNNSIHSLIGAGLAGTLSDTDIFAVFERASGTNPIDLANTAPAGSMLQSFTNVGPNPYDFVMAGDLSGADDFFEARLNCNGAGEFINGSQAGGFIFTQNTLSPGTVFLPVATVGVDGTALGFSQVTIDQGSNISPSTDTPEMNGFEFQNNTQFTVNAVPEPATMLAFGAIAGLGLVRRHRRSA